VLVASTAVAGAFVPPVAAASRALWPRVARTPPLLERAYALEAIGQEVIWTTGPLLVALALAIASPSAAVLLCAGITVAGTCWFAAAPVTRAWRGTGSAATGPAAIHSPGLRLLLVSVLLTGCVWGAGEVALVGLAGEVGAPGMAGVLLALWSAGSLVGGLVYGSRTWRLGPAERYTRMLTLTAVALLPLTLANSLAAALVLSLTAGLTIAPVLVGQYGLTGALAPPHARAEAFTWTSAATYVGFSGGAAAAGALVEYQGSDAAFGLVCAAALVAAAGTVLWRSRLVPATSHTTA
jgi:predicted MFS family arabinose efflux permease